MKIKVHGYPGDWYECVLEVLLSNKVYGSMFSFPNMVSYVTGSAEYVFFNTYDDKLLPITFAHRKANEVTVGAIRLNIPTVAWSNGTVYAISFFEPSKSTLMFTIVGSLVEDEAIVEAKKFKVGDFVIPGAAKFYDEAKLAQVKNQLILSSEQARLSLADKTMLTRFVNAKIW